jgi:uncharacterized protein YgbK (DUF1537 family)
LPSVNFQTQRTNTGSSSTKRPWLGIIADDFTGATDVAGYLVRQGTSTIQIFGLPNNETHIADVDCVIIALKTRSVNAEQAVNESLQAYAWLKEIQVDQIYFKYCSTFDSTPAGNIGPVGDALLKASGEHFLTFCPSAPENGRFVFQGHLFVNDLLLEESPLRNHPLNPMTDSDIRDVLKVQSKNSVNHIPYQTITQGPSEIKEKLETFKEKYFHVVMDAVTNSDLDKIAQAIASNTISSGSAGLAAAIARVHGNAGTPLPAIPEIPDRTVLISGSLSDASRNQVQRYASSNPTFEVDPMRIASGIDLDKEIDSFFAALPEGSTALIHGSIDAAKSKKAQTELGVEKAASILEEALSHIAVKARKLGIRKFVVAGGETSGAVVSALGIKAIRIGSEIAVGVPWVVSIEKSPLLLVLKSGNFGGPDFFEDAIKRITTHLEEEIAR